MNNNEQIQNAQGYFGPESITWRLYREPLSLLGGVRALLLQVSHPAVADGVARYSQFKSDPFGRGYRTFTAMATIYFGSKQQAQQTAQGLFRLHSAIRGEIPQAYSANQPQLLLWVLATLIDTTLQVYERMPVSGLPADWPERFYEESKIAAHLLGIQMDQYPPDLQAFESYFKRMLEGDILGSHPVCREMAQAILKHPKAPQKLANLLATGWLPATLCKQLGIEVGIHATEKMGRWLDRFYWFYRLLPGRLCYGPAYYQALYRIAKARDERPPWAGRFIHWLGKRMKIPMGIG